MRSAGDSALRGGGCPDWGGGANWWDSALPAFCKCQGKARLTFRLGPSPVCKPSPEVLQVAEQIGVLAGCPLYPAMGVRHSQAELQQLQLCETRSERPVLAREQLGGGGHR